MPGQTSAAPTRRNPFSLGAQAAALLSALNAAREPALATRKGPTASELRRMHERYARANTLRRCVLELLSEHDSGTVRDCQAQRPDVSHPSWVWVFKTLADAGLVEREDRPGHRNATRYRITPAGRAAIAPGVQHPSLTTGETQ